SGGGAKGIMPAFVPWRSSGFGFCFVAGGTACLTPSNGMWRRSESTALARPRRPPLPIPHQRFPGFSGKAVEGFRNSPKFPLDGLTQKSDGRGSDQKRRIINGAFRAPTVREGLLHSRATGGEAPLAEAPLLYEKKGGPGQWP